MGTGAFRHRRAVIGMASERADCRCVTSSFVGTGPPTYNRRGRVGRLRVMMRQIRSGTGMDKSFLRQWSGACCAFILAVCLIVLPGLAAAQEAVMVASPEGQPVQMS